MTFLFGENIVNVSDWSYIDFVSIKVKSGTIKQAIYLFDGHPLYDTSMTLEDKAFVAFARKIGCYGNSEKMFDADGLSDRFYIKTNIKSSEQQNGIIEYLCHKKTLSQQQRQILGILEKLENVLDVGGDYKPLYYCGFAKKTDSAKYSQIRFYFKTFAADETVRFDTECVQYFEKFPIFQSDSTFDIVKELVYSKKAGLRCIGLEFGNNNSIKIKYYLCESANGNPIKAVLTELLSFPQLHKSGISALKAMESFQDLGCSWIQISNGICDGDANINLYLEPVHRQKRKFYFLKEGLVLRNIGEIWFLIDIHEKHYYETKNLFMLNDTGKIIIEFLMTNKVCTIDGIVSYVKSQIVDYIPELNSVIYDDCSAFILTLSANGFLMEVM